MYYKMLEAKNHVDPETGCLCRYVKSDTEYFRPHYHNYYELFLMFKGTVCHVINGKEQMLNEGQLLFIRDFDAHDYKSPDGKYFEFINLAFTKETFATLTAFLGEGFSDKNLFSPALPPIVNLPTREIDKISHALIELNGNSDKEYVIFKSRALLVYIFSNFFVGYTEEKSVIPPWLEITYEKMKQPKHFTQGAKHMYELSGKSREYLTRCMQQYYHTTPTAYVAGLRLNHAANLLLISNLNITEICYECGFDNLSWFYKRFAEKYGESPSEYRKKRKN